MSNETVSALDRDSVSRFARHARAGLFMTLVGAAIVVGSLAYSTQQLSRVQAERTALDAKLKTAADDLQKVKASRDLMEGELKQLQSSVKNARDSFFSVQMGLRQFFVKDYRGAVKFYDKAIAVDPLNPVLHDLKGYALLRDGDIQGAISALEKSIETGPDYVWGHYNLSLAYAAAGEMVRAVAQIRKVLELDPSMKSAIRGDGQFRVFRSNAEFQALMREA